MLVTYRQGVSVLIETVVFILVFYIYTLFSGSTYKFAEIMLSSSLFILWAFTLSITYNILLALSVPIPKVSSIPYDNYILNI